MSIINHSHVNAKKSYYNAWVHFLENLIKHRCSAKFNKIPNEETLTSIAAVSLLPIHNVI